MPFLIFTIVIPKVPMRVGPNYDPLSPYRLVTGLKKSPIVTLISLRLATGLKKSPIVTLILPLSD